MEIKLIKNTESDYFNEAIKLGDSNSKTLGFLPYEAFKKYAKENKLIGVFEKSNSNLMGYLLYRISFNRVTIVHCCISEKYRNKNVAFNLVEYLKKNTKQYDGIKLSCRNDYGIDRVWERFNFVPVTEKIGRSKEGLPLTIWWYPHHKNDLFSQVSDYETSNKVMAVIDMNIFLDIKHKREQESLALNSDWLIGEAILYYTREILVEINRSQTQSQKKTSRKLLNYYTQLPYKDENDFLSTLNQLKELIPLNSINDKSDLNHIAYSIVGGANYFITRDKNILNKRKILLIKYDLKICRPSDFITYLDENIQVSKYKPKRLIGTNIDKNCISAENIDFYVKTFLQPSEKKHQFEKTIRDSLAYPDKFELITISKKEEQLAFVIFDRSSKNKIKIPVFRFLKHSLKITLSKHLLYTAILASTNENKTIVEISEKITDEDIIQTIQESRFTQINNKWRKINIKRIIENSSSIPEIIKKQNPDFDNDLFFNKISSKTIEETEINHFYKTYNLERHLSPLKIKNLEIPTYIISIQPQWAEKLFDDKSSEELNLFETKDELLLNRENVYYRSAKNNLKSPSRILWYISENKTTKCKGKIRAVSYIDDVFIDSPKKLYKQFRNLGVYEWEQINKTANGKDELMAFVFSDTELFKNSISLKNLKELMKKMESKNFMVLSPVEIKTETYLALYKTGMEL